MAVVARSTEEGSRTLVHAAGQGVETHGKYLSECHVANPSSFLETEDGKRVQEQVWVELSRKLEEIQPGVMNNL